MILKSLLKYKIFEWCLDTIFEKIIFNFSNVNLKSKLNVGDRFSKIKYYSLDEFGNIAEVYRYYDCNILHIKGSIVKFNYMRVRESPFYAMIEGYGISSCDIEGLEFTK